MYTFFFFLYCKCALNTICFVIIVFSLKSLHDFHKKPDGRSSTSSAKAYIVSIHVHPLHANTQKQCIMSKTMSKNTLEGNTLAKKVVIRVDYTRSIGCKVQTFCKISQVPEGHQVRNTNSLVKGLQK